MTKTLHILLLVSIFTITICTPTEGKRMSRNDYTFVGGDIRIPSCQLRNGIRSSAKHWPSGIIPYEIVGDYEDYERDILMRGMEEYHKFTCIKFIPKTAAHKDYITIVRTENACWSDLGYLKGVQTVNYGERCLETVGQAIHELMHTVGFDHEHNRADRDEYLEIKYENVEKGLEFNFDKVSNEKFSDYGVPYNYYSVMHYEEYTFSKDDTSLPTMVAKKPHDKPIGGVFAKTFAKTDIKKINLMYKCRRRLL